MRERKDAVRCNAPAVRPLANRAERRRAIAEQARAERDVHKALAEAQRIGFMDRPERIA